MRSDRLIIGLAVVVFLIAYTVAIFSFFSAPEGESQLVYLALVGLPLAIAMIAYPQAALVVLGLLVYSIDWLSEHVPAIPREATWLIDILIIIQIARSVLFMPVRHERVRAIEGLVYIILAFTVVAALIDGVSRATLLIGLRVGFRYVLLFVAAYHLNVSREWLRKFIVIIFLVGLIQTPIILAQYHFLGWSDPDSLSGTFGRGQTPGIGLYLLVLFCYMAARMIEERKMRILYLVIIAWMSVGPIMGEVKFYFLFLPLLIVFLVRAEFFKRPMVALGLFLVGAALIYAVDYVTIATGGWKEGRNPLTYVRTLPDVFSKEIQEPQTERFERSYRFVYALRLAADSPQSLLLGNGTGSITHSYVSTEHSPKAAYFSRWGLSSSAETIAWMLIEYGYLGTALFMYLLWRIFRRGRILRQSQDMELRVYGRLLEAMTFLYVAWLFYINAWQGDSMNFIFWPLAGMFVYLSYGEEAAQKEAIAEQRLAELKQPVPEYVPHVLR